LPNDKPSVTDKAVLVDASGAAIARGARPVPVVYPKPAWVEQGPHAMSDKMMPSACEVDITGVISMYARQKASGEPAALVDRNNNYADDPLPTFGNRAVVKVPRFQELMRHVCKNGFERRTAMTMGYTANVLEEVFGNYMGCG
jgi:L-fucose isomerase-like protein